MQATFPAPFATSFYFPHNNPKIKYVLVSSVVMTFTTDRTTKLEVLQKKNDKENIST
jgi:hypothetical protein